MRQYYSKILHETLNIISFKSLICNIKQYLYKSIIKPSTQYYSKILFETLDNIILKSHEH